MRKISLILLLMAVLLLVGCSLPGGATYDNTDIIPVEGQAGLYTDARLAFCSEIRGAYAADRPFALDAEHPSLRVWDDIYLYEGDYFQLVASRSADIFFAVKEEDHVYVTEEERFAYATVKEGASGIYRVSFDLESKLFDLEYKGEILSPVYPPMDGCDVYSLASDFTPMVLDPSGQGWMIKNYPIEAGALISFHNHGEVHLSNYKIIPDAAAQGTYVGAMEGGDKHITFAVGGVYNLYIDPITYVLRVELADPDSAAYVLMRYENGEPVSLSPVDPSTPHLFRYRYTARRSGSMPIFVGGGYLMFDLAVIPSEELSEFEGEYYFAQAGEYDITIDLSNFTLSVSAVAE